MGYGIDDLPEGLRGPVRAFALTQKGQAGLSADRDDTACKTTCVALISRLRELGMKPRLLELRGWRGPTAQLHRHHADEDPASLFHHTVEIDGWSIDFTARQFDPHTEVPEVRRVQDLGGLWDVRGIVDPEDAIGWRAVRRLPPV